jgi:pantoate--beta-alanine ligase
VKRPGHFSGVLTVVMMWLQIVKPQRSYFGEKDYQQYQLIRDMTQTFFMDIEIIACPTIREASGLAFSSRNTLLNAEERHVAEQFAQIFHQNKTCEDITKELRQLGINIDYVEDRQQRRFAAVYIGDIRLIDNYALDEMTQ